MKKKTIREIIEKFKNSEEFSTPIGLYGEWNHTRMWETLEPAIEKILKDVHTP